MPHKIQVIPLGLPYHLGSVNCYLVQAGSGHLLIDTGPSNSRFALERELANADCYPGNLSLILLTHGDFDHAGNAAYLRGKFNTPIAMHRDDSGMVVNGDMFWSRNSGNRLLRSIAPILVRFGKSERFEPDFFVMDGFALGNYGFEATVLSLPGHSKGSVGIRTSTGEVFCGDLLENTRQPALGSIMDDASAAATSVKRLQEAGVTTVYPGHGHPFLWEQFASGAGMKPNRGCRFGQ